MSELNTLDTLRSLQPYVFAQTDLDKIDREQIANKIDALFTKDTVERDYGEILDIIARFPHILSLSSMKDQSRYGTSYTDVFRGYHLIRSYLAHIADAKRKARYKPTSWRETSETIDTYHAKGYVAVPNFLRPSRVNEILDEIKGYPLATSKNSDNLLKDAGTPGLRAIQMTSGLYDILVGCLGFEDDESRSMFNENTFIQKLHNKHGDGDVQKAFHQDTFFPALKFWYFPEEVTLEDGPLEYVLKSHIFSPQRIRYTSRCAKDIIRGYNRGWSKDHNEGSLRISPANILNEYKSTVKFNVPANTLVVANVFGFHRRSEVTTEGYRSAIHGSMRTAKPFK